LLDLQHKKNKNLEMSPFASYDEMMHFSFLPPKLFTDNLSYRINISLLNITDKILSHIQVTILKQLKILL
jgi:hypothetical protein